MKDTSRILIALPNDMLGGAEQFLKMIATYYAGIGDEVHVFFITQERFKGWSDLKDNAHIKLYFGVGNSERKGAVKFIRSLTAQRGKYFKLAFTSHIHLTGIVGFLRRMGILRIGHFIGRESTSIFKRFSGTRLKVFRFFYGLGYSQLDLLICQTEYMKQQLLSGIPRIARRLNVQVLHNPVDLRAIEQKATNGWAEDYGFSGKRYIVSAGRLINEKGYDNLIKAFSKVSEQRDDLHLLILGEGEQRAQLEGLATTLVPPGKWSMPGRVENVYPFFRHAELCVVSSRVEGFPNVLLQMMSQNPNVISTLCAGGIDEIPGLPVCEPLDVDTMTILMADMLQEKEEARKRRDEQFKSYLNEHSLEKFMTRVNTLIAN